MPFDPFINVSQPLTQAQLETELASLQRDYMAQQRIISSGAGDTNFSMQVVASIEQAIERIYLKLNQLDPTHYPIASIVRVDRTRVQFGNL